MPSPMLQQTVTAAALSAISNILAQLITAQKTGQSFTIDADPVAKFVLFAALSTPPNILWQEFLEDAFPGENKKKQLPVGAAYKKEKEGEKPVRDVAADKVQEKSAGMNWWNILIKFLLDQTVGGVVNTVLFIAGMKALNGAGGEEIKVAVKEGLWPIFLAGMKLWPLVSIISFTVLPVEKRVVFGSVVGVAWGVYLSLMAAQ